MNSGRRKKTVLWWMVRTLRMIPTQPNLQSLMRNSNMEDCELTNPNYKPTNLEDDFIDPDFHNAFGIEMCEFNEGQGCERFYARVENEAQIQHAFVALFAQKKSEEVYSISKGSIPSFSKEVAFIVMEI